jgi:hypothetical protein
MHYIPRDRNFGARALGRKYGLSHSSILDAISGATWNLNSNSNIYLNIDEWGDKNK